MTNALPSDFRSEDGPSAEAIAGFRAGMEPFWHPVLEAASLADRPRAVTLLGRRLVLVRLDGVATAFPDTCRHFQAQLSLGSVVRVDGRELLQCNYHGWAFAGDGACARIPQLPAGRCIPKTAGLRRFAVAERHGLIWVCLAEEPRFPIPDFPEEADPRFRKVRLLEEHPMRTSATRMIMGTLDDTHFPWVHEGILGDRAHPEPPLHRVWREGAELIVQYEADQPAGIMTTDMSRPESDAGTTVRLTYTDHVGMPNVIRLVKESAAGRYVVWLATSPVDYNLTINFWIFARDYDLTAERDPVYLQMAAHVREQDRPLIESQRPWIVPPFWTQIELPLGPGDLPLIEYQKWIEELGIATAV